MDGLAFRFSIRGSIDDLVARVREQLSALQKPDGHFVFELEADATIPAEYIMLRRYLGETDSELEAEIGTYLRSRQGRHGGWPLFHDGDFDMSASVKAYYALKLIGDDVDAPHMRRAREAILSRGGAARSNVLTRFLLALYGQIPWYGVPVMMVEVMLLPRWFPFHLSKVSYWSRVTLIPMLILQALKPLPRNGGVDIRELFTVAPELERNYNINPTGSRWGDLLLGLDGVLHKVERFLPRPFRQRAIDAALAFIRERLNGEDGLGAIFPPMAFLVMAYHALGMPTTEPEVATARLAVDKLLIRNKKGGYCQPCVSPVWDTSLAAHALLEAGALPDSEAVRGALDWLRDRQILDTVGDWADSSKTDLRPGGWAFQYGNDYYPDVDDTAVVGMVLHRTGDERYRHAWERAAEWVIGMQSKNGGWGAYDADNTHDYLNHIPFADHGALLDPPTADVSARCVGFLAQLGYGMDHPAVKMGVDYLLKEQEPDGSWFGRWGTNYVYGTWSVLCALNAVGMDHEHPAIRKAVNWILVRQAADGGWGEDCATYWDERRTEVKGSTPSQTAWALLGLMAAGEVGCDSVRRGVEFLEQAPRSGARWEEQLYTGVGFPRVFYLRYHGYAAYFPLWAISRFRTLINRNDRRVAYGI
ncbi:MAG: squalene--hopene cyclase [Rhodospirillaceae bacterium]